MTTNAIEQVQTPAGKLKLLKKLQGRDVGIPVRKMGLTYGEELPTLWFGGNGLLTAFFSAFSATLPEGEDQFLYSVRLFQNKITDPILQAQVRAFIGQEAHHSREHEALNNAMIGRGFPLDKIENAMRQTNGFFRKYMSPELQLANTVCGEHITALMAYHALTEPDFLELMAEPTRTAWAWHAIEELEHKGVAFDVYDQLVGDRNLLRRTMIFMSVLFFTTSTFQALNIMRHTGQLTNVKEWRKGLKVLGRMVSACRSDYMDFYKPDYHPWQHECREVLRRAKAQYLAESE